MDLRKRKDYVGDRRKKLNTMKALSQDNKKNLRDLEKYFRNQTQKISADKGRDILDRVLYSLPDRRKTAAQRFKERYGK